MKIETAEAVPNFNMDAVVIKSFKDKTNNKTAIPMPISNSKMPANSFSLYIL